MIKYLLYLLIIYSVIKMYRYRVVDNYQIIYASLSLILGIIIIDWLLPKSIYEKFTQYIKYTPDHSQKN